MDFEKIKDEDLLGRGVIGQAEVPGLSAAEMQFKVEEIVRTVVIPKLNAFIDKVSEVCAEKTELSDLSAEIDNVIADFKTEVNTAFDAAVTEMNEALSQNTSNIENDMEQLETDVSEIIALNSAATNLAINEFKQSVNRTIEEFDKRLSNTIIESGAVVSVFGRIGEVKAQDGDYTPEQVGAAPSEHSHSELLSKSGGTMTGDIEMGGNKITGLYSPTDSMDAANRDFVEKYVNEAVSAATQNIVTDVIYVGTEAPANKKLLWIDSGNSFSAKFYNAEEDLWQNVTAVWS